jgi:outer membrane protein TolC
VIALVLAGALQAALPQDSLPQVTLEEALRRGTNLDPGYVAALGQVRDAKWQRTAAIAAFIVPAVTVQTTAQWYSSDIFNIGTGQLSSKIFSAQAVATLDVFRGGQHVFDLQRRRAEFASATASEVEARFRTALFIESDFYDVLAQQELLRVAEERVRRAGEQLAVARARVLTGAAVQTDSLQLLLELTRARVDLLRARALLTVARIQLGRRMGVTGPMGAVPLDPTPPPSLPITEDQAVAEALEQSPTALVVRADQRAAEAGLRSAWGLYLPVVTLSGLVTAYDAKFFPSATSRAGLGLTVSLPIWNNAQREIALSHARTTLDVARAVRSDAELGVQRDVVEAYEAYTTARAAFDLAREAVTVAQENLRVQDERYRAGATTILDLVTAQVSFTEAEAGLVQARYASRLAFAGVEALLGRRFGTEERQ